MKENIGKRAFCGHSEEGSIIVVALMVLAIISVIGVMATETVVTENYIIRNVAIHKQNINLAEGAIMEGIQTARMLDPVSQMNPNSSSTDWINSDEDTWTQEDWYDNCAIRLLDANNSIVPQMVSTDNTG